MREGDLVGSARCRWCAIATMTTSPDRLRPLRVMIRGYVDRVEIVCGSEQIACHRRSYAREDFVFDPLHYLALLEQKPGALDQAAPLAGWQLPDGFGVLRRLLEARLARLASGSSCRFCVCWKRSGSTMSPPPLAPPWRAARSASMPSSIWCCAGSNGGHRGSI